MTDVITIRPLTELADFDACVRLQEEVWHYGTSDAMSQKVFLLASRIGGQVLGAFAENPQSGNLQMASYAMALPGIRDGRPYLHSHHLAVLPPWRNAGVGRRLKLAQRDEALSRGIDLMEWTFDPLEIKNAHLNLARLGAVVRRYWPNFYGPSTSPLQGGLPTDRIYAEWYLRSPHVTRALAGDPPAEAVLDRVIVPASLSSWKTCDADRPRALERQAANAQALQAAFAAGLTAIGYERTSAGDGAFLLGHFQENA